MSASDSRKATGSTSAKGASQPPTRVTHTPCGQPVDLTDDNRILTPDSTEPHACGPYTAVRHGHRWTVEFVLDLGRRFRIHDHQGDAIAHARQLNQQWHTAHSPRPPQPQQAALFDPQEVAS